MSVTHIHPHFDFISTNSGWGTVTPRCEKKDENASVGEVMS